LADEPEASNPESCAIVFRLPVTGSRVERRFLKTDSVQILYDFIDTQLHQITLEGDGQYEILQTMPRKIYEDKDALLQEVGLFPRAMLVVKEVD